MGPRAKSLTENVSENGVRVVQGRGRLSRWMQVAKIAQSHLEYPEYLNYLKWEVYVDGKISRKLVDEQLIQPKSQKTLQILLFSPKKIAEKVRKSQR